MALSDLTPEQIRMVEESLLAPPPETFQTQQQLVDPLLRAQAASGMLGSAGRFIEQIAREQERKQQEERVNRLAQEAMRINPLDPDYLTKTQRLAMQDPEAFSSPIVQRALSVGEAQAQQAQQQMEQQLQTQLMQATPEQRENFLRSGSPFAIKQIPLLKTLEEKDVAIEESLAQLPEELRPQGPISAVKAKSLVRKFENELPPALRKVPTLQARAEVANLAAQHQATKDDKLKTDLAMQITEALGMDTSRTLVTDTTIKSIADASTKLGKAPQLESFKQRFFAEMNAIPAAQ